MADKTTGELPAVKVGSLPMAPDIYDETLIPVEQQGIARHMTGAQWKSYAQASVNQYVNSAKGFADDAKKSASSAANSATTASGAAAQAVEMKNDTANLASAAEEDANSARQSAIDAAASKSAIENMKATAHSIAASSEATVTKSVASGVVTLYFGIPRGDQGAVGPRGPQGIQGPEGEQGPPGESGVVTPASGWFTLAGDADGNLWACYNDSDTPPKFEVDASGNIYYITPDAA